MSVPVSVRMFFPCHRFNFTRRRHVVDTTPPFRRHLRNSSISAAGTLFHRRRGGSGWLVAILFVIPHRRLSLSPWFTGRVRAAGRNRLVPKIDFEGFLSQLVSRFPSRSARVVATADPISSECFPVSSFSFHSSASRRRHDAAVSATCAKLRSRHVNMPVNLKPGCAGVEEVAGCDVGSGFGKGVLHSHLDRATRVLGRWWNCSISAAGTLFRSRGRGWLAATPFPDSPKASPRCHFDRATRILARR